jgi:hypothetical protein
MKKILVVIFIALMVAVSLICCWIFGAFAQGSVSGNHSISESLYTGNCSYLEPVFGDVNEDLRVSIGDVTKIERIILGLDPVTAGADANVNGVVDMGDVVKVERMILGLYPIYGDANGDCRVDHADVIKVQRIILGLEPSTLGADANRDGRVSISDVTHIERMILKCD